MDKALQNALVEMAATRKRSDVKQEDSDEEREGEGEGEDGEEGEGGKGEGLRWVHEFVAAALPGSRHQVRIYFFFLLWMWLEKELQYILHYPANTVHVVCAVYTYSRGGGGLGISLSAIAPYMLLEDDTCLHNIVPL